MKEELSAAKINLEAKVSRCIYSVHNNEICYVYKYTTYSFRNRFRCTLEECASPAE